MKYKDTCAKKIIIIQYIDLDWRSERAFTVEMRIISKAIRSN